ncbi:MAG TPA: mechanosensitive ion channel family protein [Patescibacteria group bacterium]|nr:mechanosensitive ion channel family protein [Patescibacteria group bacterium]
MQEYFQQPFFSQIFFSNTLLDYTIALGIFLFLTIIIKTFHAFAINKLEHLSKRTTNDIDDVMLATIKTIKAPFYLFLTFYIALSQLTLSETFLKIITIILFGWAIFQGVHAAAIAFNYFLKKFMRKETNEESKAAMETINVLFKTVLWVLGGLLLLSNMGFNITSLIAGLGIGGIAVALAMQNILSDLFSSFAIYFDKPFKVGDFIVVGDKMGVVEKIGIKTTRIRALQGEEIVISNQELTSAQIQNFKKMNERRIVFSFGITYQTPQKKLEKIPQMVKDIIIATKETRFDRAHFFKFGDSALIFEVVYYVISGEYNTYMDIQQTINFALHEKLEKENISMAYPTQTLYLHKK